MSDIVNRVRVLAPSATGTSSAALGSAYSAKYLTPSEAGCIDGRRYTWLIEQGNDVELVEGAWTSSGNTAARTKVIFSKISGSVGTSKINLNGTAVISIVQAAEDMGSMRGSRTVTGSSDTIAATDLNRPIVYNRATAIAVSIGQAGDTGGFIEGWLTWVQNKGVGAVTITPTTSTIDGAATLVLQQNQGALIWSDGTNYQSFLLRNDVGVPVRADAAQSLTAVQQNQAQRNAGIPAVMRSYLAGLTLSTAGSSSTFSVAAGVATDSTNADMMTLASAMSKTTGAWAVGSTNGSLDASTIANNTWYHVHLIKRVDTQVVDVLISLSPTAPTLPANYTLSRRIGSLLTNGSAQWVKFVQDGDWFMWDVVRKDANPATPGDTLAHSVALSTPYGVRTKAIIAALGADATNCRMLISSLAVADIDVTVDIVYNVGATVIGSGLLATQSASQVMVDTNLTSQVRYRSSSNSASLYMATQGYVDTRGRNA